MFTAPGIRAVPVLLIVAALALAGCGREGDAQTNTASAAPDPVEDMGATTENRVARPGVRVVLRDSEFGPMLFDAKGQAIYIFANDRSNHTVCYGQCAEDWPPVITRGAPRAGRGLTASLLGTVQRQNGAEQVTYAGRPLYFYSHEAPGEVLCHNVDLNGGFWWVIGADGKRRPA